MEIIPKAVEQIINSFMCKQTHPLALAMGYELMQAFKMYNANAHEERTENCPACHEHYTRTADVLKYTREMDEVLHTKWGAAKEPTLAHVLNALKARGISSDATDAQRWRWFAEWMTQAHNVRDKDVEALFSANPENPYELAQWVDNMRRKGVV